jgi:transposase
MNATFSAWGTQTFNARLTTDQLIPRWVIKDAKNGEAFAAYVRDVLVPELQPGTGIICDNLATHQNKEAAAALKARGYWFLFWPPYSPDLNPIEMAFSKLTFDGSHACIRSNFQRLSRRLRTVHALGMTELLL